MYVYLDLAPIEFSTNIFPFPAPQYVSYGHTLMCSPQGKVISTSTPEEEGEAIVFARVDPEAMKAARSSLPLWNSQRTDVYGTLSGPQ